VVLVGQALKLLYTYPDPIQAGLLSSLLESRGIATLVRHQYLSGAVGELPPDAIWPEVWVLHESDLPEATQLLAQLHATPTATGEPWRCPHCGEMNEAQFALCWACGRETP